MNKKTEKVDFFERTFQAVNVPSAKGPAAALAFSEFRDAVASAGQRWQFETTSEKEFQAQFANLNFGEGQVSWSSTSDLVGSRTGREISTSDSDCFCMTRLLSGDVLVKQAGREVIGMTGDVLIVDCSLPVQVTMRALRSYDALTLFIPRTMIARRVAGELTLQNIRIPEGVLTSPLSSCLTSLAEELMTASPDELSALYEACVLLLPAATTRLARDSEYCNNVNLNSSRLGRELRLFINENLSNAELSPMMGAQHIGMSLRYVHRLFALNGTTFNSYVTANRLERVRRDLVSEESRKLPISIIAYRWGFNDLSTFIRAFTKRFKCTPRQFRSRS